MSTLPSRDLGSASSSSSSQAPFPNPNSNHGLHFLPQRQPPIPTSQLRPQSSPDCEPQFLQSLQISNSVDTSYDVSGTLAPAAENTLGTSKKVKESSESIGKNFVARQHNGKNFRCGAGTAQYREKPAEVVSSHIQQNSGRVNCQASSTHTAGRKPQMVNGNHLLNFHYDPISRPQSRVAPPLRRHQKRKPYNKDLFLQANYKFVVLDSGNHAPEMLDPDKLLMWEDILCLKFSTPLPVKCPICLDDPLCPQITSCGHIFCFPCIIRYFLNSEFDHKGEIWKKCPLCFVMISSKDLYTIYIENVKQHSVGDTAEFMLLTRQKDSLTLSLKNKESIGTDEEAPDSYSKFTCTSDVDLSVRNAVSDLDSWLARADSGLVDDLEKLPYVCAAMEQLEQRRKYWNERRVGHEKARESPPSADYANVHHDPGKWGSLSISGNVKLKLVGDTFSDNVDGEASLDRSVDVVEPAEGVEGALSSLCEENKSMQNNFDGFRGGNEKDSYNFYQAIDGQHLILHPLNTKCLLHHYGNYDKLPHRISGKILQLETVTQSEAMRRRYRFLSHFSLTTSFQLCEIDLGGFLPPDALSPFMDEIKNREKQRKRLANKERREKIRADAAAAALASDMVASIRYNNFAECFHDIAPTFSMDDFEALGGGSPSVVSSSPPTLGEKMHFANVARLGFAAGHDSPALRIESNSPCNSKLETTSSDSSGAIVSSFFFFVGMRKNGDPPSFANIISRAKNVQGVEASKTNEVAKKGKKHMRVLLSTSGGRRY